MHRPFSIWCFRTTRLACTSIERKIRLGTSLAGSLPTRTQMQFSPNSGYAFAVADDTWHSADTVGPEVTTRDSILLTYFVDSGVLRVMRNRGKRVGNFVLNEIRHRI